MFKHDHLTFIQQRQLPLLLISCLVMLYLLIRSYEFVFVFGSICFLPGLLNVSILTWWNYTRYPVPNGNSKLIFVEI